MLPIIEGVNIRSGISTQNFDMITFIVGRRDVEREREGGEGGCYY